jgi:hypothetical protein
MSVLSTVVRIICGEIQSDTRRGGLASPTALWEKRPHDADRKKDSTVEQFLAIRDVSWERVGCGSTRYACPDGCQALRGAATRSDSVAPGALRIPAGEIQDMIPDRAGLG